MNHNQNTPKEPEMVSLLLGAGFALASLIILPAIAQRGALIRAENRF